MDLVILGYHKLINEEDDNQKHTIPVKLFDEHMRILSLKGYGKTSFTNLIVKKTSMFEKKIAEVIISFDDGNKSDFEIATKILQKYKMKAMFFVTTSDIGKEGYLSWKEVNEMAKLGMSIQSHTESHKFLDIMTDKEIEYELECSQKKIESNTNEKVNYISLPYGFGSYRLKNIAYRCGYSGIFNSKPGINVIKKRKIQEFKRNMINRKTTIREFMKIIDRNNTHYLKKEMIYLPKVLIRKIIGSSNYYKLYEKYSKNIN